MALYPINPNAMRGSGTFTKGRAGEALGRCKIVYKNADGSWYLADADLVALMPTIGLTMDRVTAGQHVRILKEGYIGRVDWAWVTGTEMYASGVPGELVQVAVGIVQIVGMATRTNMIYFDPEGTGAGGVVCALLEGATAYVGFDVCKGDNYTNYWTCDGVADDVQVVLALAYLSGLGGGLLFMEAGDYAFAAQVNVDFSNVSIEGAGADTVITYLVDGGFAFRVFNVAGIEHVTVRNIKFVGAPAALENQLLGFLNVTYPIVEGCHFEDSGDEAIVFGFSTAACRYGKIIGNTFKDCPSADAAGAAIDVLTGTHQIKDNVIVGGIGRGIMLEAIAGTELIESVEISGNKIFGEDTVLMGIVLGAVSFDIRHITILNNEIYDCLVAGIIDAAGGTENIADILVHGNLIEGGGTDAAARGAINFIKNEPENITITDNIVRTWDVSAANKFGMQLTGTDYLIDSNQVNDTGDSGIKVSADKALVSNNFLEGIGQGGGGNRAGIEINASDDVHCLGNFIEDSWNGIRIFAVSNNCVVKDNKFTNIAVLMFTDAGVDTAVHWFFAPISDPNAVLGRHPAVDMPENTDTNVYAQIMLPLEFQQLVTSHVIVVAAAAGNMVWTVNTDFGKLCATEDYNAHSDVGGDTTALLIDDFECIDISAALTLIAAGDLIGVDFMRDGNDVADDIEDSVYYMGIKMRYV